MLKHNSTPISESDIKAINASKAHSLLDFHLTGLKNIALKDPVNFIWFLVRIIVVICIVICILVMNFENISLWDFISFVNCILQLTLPKTSITQTQ